MKNNKYSELILGFIILGLGIFYFLLTNNLPAKDTIDSRFLPYILCGFLFILGLVQISRGLQIIKNPGKKEEEKDLDYLTLIKTLVLIILYIGFLNILGFILATSIFLFLTFIVLTPNRLEKNYILYLFIAIVTSLIVYFLFRQVLNLILPRGIFEIGGIYFERSFNICHG